MSEKRYFVMIHGSNSGPFTEQEIFQKHGENVVANSNCQEEGSCTWRQLQHVFPHRYGLPPIIEENNPVSEISSNQWTDSQWAWRVGVSIFLPLIGIILGIVSIAKGNHKNGWILIGVSFGSALLVSFAKIAS